MKLYANIETSRGKQKGIGDDKWLEIELSCRNNLVGRIILDYQGGSDWELSYQQGNDPSHKIDSCITPKPVCAICKNPRSSECDYHDFIPEDNKGKKQKDEMCHKYHELSDIGCVETHCMYEKGHNGSCITHN